jgi:hypothetical protein
MFKIKINKAMQIITNNIKYPDYSILAIERDTDRVHFTPDGLSWYELPIETEYETIDRIEGDRVTGRFCHEWNANNLHEEDLKQIIKKDFNYRKEEIE